MVGCPFAAVLCQVNLLQSEDASLRCVGTQTLMQVAKVGKNGFTSFTCRTLLAKNGTFVHSTATATFFGTCLLYIFRVTTQSSILQFGITSTRADQNLEFGPGCQLGRQIPSAAHGS